MNNNQSNNQDQTLLSSMYGSGNNTNQDTMMNNNMNQNTMINNNMNQNTMIDNNTNQNTMMNSQSDNSMNQDIMPNNLITITDECSNTMANNNGIQNMMPNNFDPNNNCNQSMMPNNFQPNNNVPINNGPNPGNAGGLNIPNNQLGEDLEKAAKRLNMDFITLGVLLAIAMVGVISQGAFSFIYVLEFILIVGGFVGSKEKKPYAAVCGIILGTLLILSLSLIDIMLGVFVISASIKYNGILKKSGVHSNVLLYSFIGIVAVVGITFALAFAEELVVSKPLTCTRKDGDVIEISFDKDGISDLKINGKEATAAEKLSYDAEFLNTFFYEAYAVDTASDKIKIYKNIVELYEVKEFEATCE